jgi:hypothetical protein
LLVVSFHTIILYFVSLSCSDGTVSPFIIVRCFKTDTLAENIFIKELLDNQLSIRPLHDKLRIANKRRPTAPLLTPCSTVLLEKLTGY